MLTPSPNPASQLERALNAHLYAAFAGQTADYRLGWDQFYHSIDWKKRALPLVETIAHRGDETIVNSRDERLMTRLEFRWKGSNELGQENKDANLVYINTMIGLIMAALSEREDNGDDNYQVSCFKIAAAGRRLAVLGRPDQVGTAAEIAANADMATFVCDKLQYRGPLRAENTGEAFVIREVRNFTFDCYNNTDDSIFPALTFDAGTRTLNWTLTLGSLYYSEPAAWLVQKSANGRDWLTLAALGTGARSNVLDAGNGTLYYRVCPSDDGATPLDPESNLVKATT